jgi:hypothetical protein
MIAALRAAETKTERSGGAGRKRGVGEMNSRPALAFAAAEFRASKTGAPLNSNLNLAQMEMYGHIAF